MVLLVAPIFPVAHSNFDENRAATRGVAGFEIDGASGAFHRDSPGQPVYTEVGITAQVTVVGHRGSGIRRDDKVSHGLKSIVAILRSVVRVGCCDTPEKCPAGSILRHSVDDIGEGQAGGLVDVGDAHGHKA